MWSTRERPRSDQLFVRTRDFVYRRRRTRHRLRPIPTAYLTNPRSPSSSPKSRSSISPKVFSPPYIMYLCAHTRERAAGHASGRSRGQSTLEVQPDPVRGGGSRGASTAWTQLRT